MIHIHHSSHDSYRARELGIFENGLLDSDVFLQVSSVRISFFLIFLSPRSSVARLIHVFVMMLDPLINEHVRCSFSFCRSDYTLRFRRSWLMCE